MLSVKTGVQSITVVGVLVASYMVNFLINHEHLFINIAIMIKYSCSP